MSHNPQTLASLSSTSSKIRYLASFGYSRGEISRMLNIRYQHVRNVLLQQTKKPVAQPIDAMVEGDISL